MYTKGVIAAVDTQVAHVLPTGEHSHSRRGELYHPRHQTPQPSGLFPLSLQTPAKPAALTSVFRTLRESALMVYYPRSAVEHVACLLPPALRHTRRQDNMKKGNSSSDALVAAAEEVGVGENGRGRMGGNKGGGMEGMGKGWKDEKRVGGNKGGRMGWSR